MIGKVWTAGLAAAWMAVWSAPGFAQRTSLELDKAASGARFAETAGLPSASANAPAVPADLSPRGGSAMSRLTGSGPAAGQAKASDIVPSPKICGGQGGVRKLFSRQNLATAGFGYCLLAIGLLTDLLGGPATWPAAALIAAHAGGAAYFLHEYLKGGK